MPAPEIRPDHPMSAPGSPPAGARRWLWLTAPLAVLVAAASIVGLAVPGFYRDPVAWSTQAVAQDAADLAYVLPVLVVSALFAARGSLRGWLVWLGALSYLVYTFVIYAFAVQHNRLFLVYVAALGCALWALIGGLAQTDWDDVKAGFSPRAPVRAMGVLLLVPAVLFTLLWLSEEVPAALAGTVPQGVVDNGVPTNPVHVIDLSMMLPAMAIVGWWAWRKRAIGYGLAPVLLVNTLFQNAAIATMMAFALRAGLPAEPVMMAVFAGMGATVLAALVWYLRAP
ncbi:MAG: hypothetical protein IPG72_03990 [Ardenticatenales bacterium]|jgi:hypothetical protein|nr:hypothetical protein [Ardenticatenales bacterium]